jgi:hypothetical protein
MRGNSISIKLDYSIGIHKLNLETIPGKIIDIGAGRYHSVFLTGSIKLNLFLP